MNRNNAKLIVVSAPSGCGKGTVLGEVFKDSDVYYSVSCTTRSPRNTEVDGVHYHFIDNKTFEQMIRENKFLEYAGYTDNYYGTPKEAVTENLAAGRDVILEIETQGAFQIKKVMPEAVLLFILPPSVKEIERRLRKRATEEESVIRKRAAQAVGEIERAVGYDYVIMNDELEKAVEDFNTVIASLKCGGSAADRFRADNENVRKLIREVLNNA